ncbi:hypothetical protein TNCV_577601 [Trichonephila clavipes]|nr:hypothetical protein TNCV_577601 [Trichonephila clavipes]
MNRVVAKLLPKILSVEQMNFVQQLHSNWTLSTLNLALCDFWLFPKMKMPWKRSSFQNQCHRSPNPGLGISLSQSSAGLHLWKRDDWNGNDELSNSISPRQKLCRMRC